MKVSIITLTFNRPHFLMQLKNCITQQTCKDFEWVVIDNASTPETKALLAEWSETLTFLKIVKFETNQYNPKDPGSFMKNCFNAGLYKSQGEYVFQISDDDLLSHDYIEKMLKLFSENPNCTTAAGHYLPIDVNGQIIRRPRVTNLRPRFMPGHELALNILKGKKSLFGAPGNILFAKRESWLKNGGFHSCLEIAEIYGIMPFGDTGFDETALLYWRYHDGQLNRAETESGFTGYREVFDFIQLWRLEEKWQIFGIDTAHLVSKTLKKMAINSAATWFILNLSKFNLKGAFNILWQTRFNPALFLKLPIIILNRKRELASNIFRVFFTAKPKSNL